MIKQHYKPKLVVYKHNTIRLFLFTSRMLQRFLLLVLWLPAALPVLYAQQPAKITIRGIAADTTNNELAFATVMLLKPSDSTLINFTRSDEKGQFSFKNVKNTPYLLKISYVGYLPLQKRLEPVGTEVHDLGQLILKPITKELMEVVVKAAKATLSIRGDTIEYDASSFKVPPGSTVEDLLRRLPGIEVDADGNIRAQGKDVKRVYVDGKTFFGDDPKAATKNLGAETLSKIQVYDEKSEQAKLTGIEDGKKEKAMNLALKDEYKKGAFGKITAAAGTDERLAARANYNRFNAKQQFSVIGYGNNINETGVNWEDYGEFKGQNTFGDNDNGDFGFSSGRRFFYVESDILNNFDGRGFTKNYGTGVNYNYDHKKTKGNLSYTYNETNLQLDERSNRETFLDRASLFNTDTFENRNFRGNHALSGRWEQNMDSSNTLIVKAAGRFSRSDNRELRQQLFYERQESPVNSLRFNNSSLLNAWRGSATAIYRHRFSQKGRSFAWSFGYNGSKSDGTDQLSSTTRVFPRPENPSVLQRNDNDNRTQQFKSSLLYTHPLSKKWFTETFYNFSNTDNVVDRQTRNPQLNARIDSLSTYYLNDILYNRIGSSLRYSNKGLNASVGLAAQQIRLDGRQSVAKDLPLLYDPIRRTFNNLVPRFELGYQLKENMWLGSEYSYAIREPQLQDLQPVPNVNNPAFQTIGNPNLRTERSHSFNLNYGFWNPAALSNFSVGIDYSIFDSQIVYNQTIEKTDSGSVRITTRPDNVQGGNNYGMYVWTGFPLIKTKLTMNVSGNARGGLAPAFVNGVSNNTRNNDYSVRVGFNFTPVARLIMGLNARAGLNQIRYTLPNSPDQNIQNHSLDMSVKWQFVNKFFLESNFDYTLYRNDYFDFRQELPIWNASVRRLIGKKNRMEMRLAAFDLLNRRLAVRQNGTQNYVTNSVANTLARYFMLSVSYNLRGYENKLNKNEWW